MEPHAQPPVTLEGWYALHQAFAVDRRALRAFGRESLHFARRDAAEALDAVAAPSGGGWSAVVRLVGSVADVLLVHFRPSLDALATVQETLAGLELFDALRPTFAFLSVTEVGLYHLPAALDAADSERHVRAERESAHTQRRLYPALPADMPYLSFYPTSKRRGPGQNWYALPLAERGELMRHHGLTGRRHAGRVRQVITGAIGLDAWEWGVTLFAADPLELKHVVTDMRYDEASAKYAEFGDFYVGRVVVPGDWARSLGA
jgi:hydrogen peroxide-dependent heme synthase